MQKIKRKTGVIIIICVALALLVAISPMLLAIYFYQSNFGGRFETASWLTRSISEFDGLERKRWTFKSNGGQNLVGYTYYKKADAVKGIIVIAHGLGGGGHNTYMNVADYFASNGYIVFAYDATGNDESEGSSVRGFPQGVIDLDYAIRFIENSDEFKDLPIMLFGHSWGAYSAGAVLNLHPDIKAVVMVAGTNKSADIIEEAGEKMVGGAIKIIMPFISIIEKLKFGEYSSYSCTDGFNASEAGVMIIYSTDDETVSYENNSKIFRELYQNDPRFVFVGYENRGHDYVYYSDASKEYRAEYNRKFADYAASTGAEINADLKLKFMEENGDKSKLFELDKELMDKITAFYDQHIGE